MELIYDNDADALEIAIGPGIISRTIEIDPGTLVDVDERGDVVAIEVIQPKRLWPLDEIVSRFPIDDATEHVLRGIQQAQGAFELEPAAPLAVA